MGDTYGPHGFRSLGLDMAERFQGVFMIPDGIIARKVANSDGLRIGNEYEGDWTIRIERMTGPRNFIRSPSM